MKTNAKTKTAKTKTGVTVILDRPVKVNGGFNSWVKGPNSYAVSVFVPCE